MKRSALKQKPRRRLSAEERRQAAEFHASVEFQPCAVCGTPWVEPDAHHVVAKAELKRRGLPLFDSRNALPLCPIGTTVGFRCHERHESGTKRVPLEVLSDDNLNYASEALGPYAGDYLRARYSGSMEESSGPGSASTLRGLATPTREARSDDEAA